jgi:hypothetical protein
MIMDRHVDFGHALTARILAIISVAAIGTACSTSVSSGSGGAGQGGQATGGGGHGGASTGSSANNEACFKPSPEPKTCPAVNDPGLAQELPNKCTGGAYFYPSGQVNTKPDAHGECCYTFSCALGTGRPYTVGDAPVAAARARRGGWGGGGSPNVIGLSAAERAALADAWTRDALMEHASIASFARFALELLAFGAPADLVEEAHRAAIDESRHARLCFELASGYAGERVGPAGFPFGGAVALSSDVASFARALVREGCVGETVAAMLASEQLATAEDPAVCAALQTIAADEGRHAELAWRSLAWLLDGGDEALRDVVRDELERASSSLVVPGEGPDAPRHGRLGAAASRATARRALAEVVAPCANALLA